MAEKFLVAEGSVSDCEMLIKKFTQPSKGNLSFEEFASVWRSTNFSLIFCGRRDENELKQLTNELLSIGKSILLNQQRPFSARLGGLYLIYGFYFHQNQKCKVRFTLNEFKELIAFTEELKEKGMKEALFIYNKLLVNRAFIFSATSNQMISRQNMDEDEDQAENGDSSDAHQHAEIFRNNLEDITAIHSGYVKVKSQLPRFQNEQSSAAAPNPHFAEQLDEMVKKYFQQTDPLDVRQKTAKK